MFLKFVSFTRENPKTSGLSGRIEHHWKKFLLARARSLLFY